MHLYKLGEIWNHMSDKKYVCGSSRTEKDWKSRCLGKYFIRPFLSYAWKTQLSVTAFIFSYADVLTETVELTLVNQDAKTKNKSGHKIPCVTTASGLFFIAFKL